MSVLRGIPTARASPTLGLQRQPKRVRAVGPVSFTIPLVLGAYSTPYTISCTLLLLLLIVQHPIASQAQTCIDFCVPPPRGLLCNSQLCTQTTAITMKQPSSQRKRKLHSRSSNPPKRRRRDGTKTLPSTFLEPHHSPQYLSPRTALQQQTKPNQAQSSKNIFPFLNLPAELRIRVYQMALQRDEPLLLHVPRAANATADEEAPPPTRNLRPVNQSTRFQNRRLPPDAEPAQRPKDAINPALLLTCPQIYKEARQVLYSENTFILQLDSGYHSLSTLHQRTRSLIKSVSLTVPSHHDILDGFADLIRLGLRYCWGLKSLTIVLPLSFPDERFMAGTTNIYANAFHILRWLPKGCKVQVEGGVNDMIRKVVEDEGRLMTVLDEVTHRSPHLLRNRRVLIQLQKSYLKRQHQMPERH